MAASRPDFGREGNGNSSARGRHLTQHSTLEPISVPTKLPSSIYCHRSGEDRRGEKWRWQWCLLTSICWNRKQCAHSAVHLLVYMTELMFPKGTSVNWTELNFIYAADVLRNASDSLVHKGLYTYINIIQHLWAFDSANILKNILYFSAKNASCSLSAKCNRV